MKEGGGEEGRIEELTKEGRRYREGIYYRGEGKEVSEEGIGESGRGLGTR
jgi:hypothetical protein